jgi:nicotinamidase-related amidase
MIKNENLVFFNVDTQQDFFDVNSVDIPNGNSILSNLQKISKIAEEKNIKTVSTLRWFKEDSPFFSEMPDYRETFPTHCVKETKGARFVNETAPKPYYLINWEGGNLIFPEIHNNRNIVVTKKVLDVFEGNQYFNSLVHNLGIPFMARPNFVLYGVDIGKTALGLLRRGYSVSVVIDANVDLTGQQFKKENIITQQVSMDSDIQPKEILDLNFITTKDIEVL